MLKETVAFVMAPYINIEQAGRHAAGIDHHPQSVRCFGHAAGLGHIGYRLAEGDKPSCMLFLP